MTEDFDSDFPNLPEIEAPLLIIRMVIRIHQSHSLKEKRKVIRSLKERLRNRFNLSVAEVGDVEKWQVATLIAVMVNQDRHYLDEQQTKIRQAVEEKLIGEGDLMTYTSEVF